MLTDVRASKMYRLLHQGESVASVSRRLKMSQKTVRKYRDAGRLPSQVERPERTYRTRPDPLAEFWSEIESLLQQDSQLKPYAILGWLKQKYNSPQGEPRVPLHITQQFETLRTGAVSEACESRRGREGRSGFGSLFGARCWSNFRAERNPQNEGGARHRRAGADPLGASGWSHLAPVRVMEPTCFTATSISSASSVHPVSCPTKLDSLLHRQTLMSPLQSRLRELQVRNVDRIHTRHQ